MAINGHNGNGHANGVKSDEEMRRLLHDHEGELAAFDRAGREAIWRHKRLGYPIVIWRDEKVVEIPANEIPEDWCSAPAGVIPS